MLPRKDMNVGDRCRFKLTKLNSGPIDNTWMARALSVSLVGCRFRGTPSCLFCEYEMACQKRCEYWCGYCEDRSLCPCGWMLEKQKEIVFRRAMEGDIALP